MAPPSAVFTICPSKRLPSFLIVSLFWAGDVFATPWELGVGTGAVMSDFQLSQISDDSMCSSRVNLECSKQHRDSSWRVFAAREILNSTWLEFGFIKFGKIFSVDLVDNSSSGTGLVRQTHSSSYITVIQSWPLMERLFASAQLGVHGWVADVLYRELGINKTNSDSNFEPMLGVGLSWQIDESWRLDMRAERFWGNGDRNYMVDSGGGFAESVRVILDLVSINLVYRLP